MGRLDNIIARNRRPNRLHERVIVSMVLGAIVVLILALAVFTDLGVPPGADGAREAPAGPVEYDGRPAAGHTRDGTRVDGVLLRRTPAPAPQR